MKAREGGRFFVMVQIIIHIIIAIFSFPSIDTNNYELCDNILSM